MFDRTRTQISARALSTVAAVATLAALGAAGQAEASTYTVSNANAQGSGSLRNALNRADRDSRRDTISFAPGLSGEVPLAPEQVVTYPVRIVGNGAVTLAGAPGGSRLQLWTTRRARSRLQNLALARVAVVANGGTRRSGGLQVIDVSLDGQGLTPGNGITAERAPLTVSGSRVAGYLGSGVHTVQSPTRITTTTIDGNGLHGAYSTLGTMVLESSTLSHNHGWGVLSGYHGSVALTNTTVSGNGNATDVDSGGIGAFDGTIQADSSTIADNYSPRAGGPGGAVGAAINGNSAGTITLANSIVAANHGANCAAGPRYVSAGGTVYDDPSRCGGISAGDVLADPLLGPLADNGGPTRTHALGAGSPAIGAATTASPLLDQRGISRDGAPDSGAYELTA